MFNVLINFVDILRHVRRAMSYMEDFQKPSLHKPPMAISSTKTDRRGPVPAGGPHGLRDPDGGRPPAADHRVPRAVPAREEPPAAAVVISII